MDTREEVFREISKRMGPDFFGKSPPLIFEFVSDKLQRRAKNEGYFRKLNALYEKIPLMTCGECGEVCCRESPDIYLLEYLYIRRFIRREMSDTELEAKIVRRALEWAFLRFVKPGTYCPFLIDGRCSIYHARPLNCRLWALEDNAYYEKKAERASRHIREQNVFFKKHGIASLVDPESSVLPKCDTIKISGDRRYSEKEILDIDLEAAFLHLTLIPHEAFRSANFHLHFPGHLAMKKISPYTFDNLCATIAREYNTRGNSPVLQEKIELFGGKIP